MGYIHPAVSEICDPLSLDPICGKFDKFLAHGQAHMGQMGKWPWQCTTRGLDNSTELRMEKIRQAVTEIWVPQVWQPPARPPGPWRQYPSSPEGWGVKMGLITNFSHFSTWPPQNLRFPISRKLLNLGSWFGGLNLYFLGQGIRWAHYITWQTIIICVKGQKTWKNSICQWIIGSIVDHS